MLVRLHGHRARVVKALYGALRSDDNEPAARLRLVGPRIGEGSPARLQRREATRGRRDDDRLLVHLSARSNVRACGDLRGEFTAAEPGAQSCAVAEVVEERAAAAFLLVPPRRATGLSVECPLGLPLVVHVVEWPTVAVVVVDLAYAADETLVDQSLCGPMRWIPGERPVHGEEDIGRGGGLDHAISIFKRGCERFFEDDVDTLAREVIDPLGMLAGGRTDDRDVGSATFDKFVHVCKPDLRWNIEVVRDDINRGGVAVPQTRGGGTGMLNDRAQEVTRVHMVEADDSDLPDFALVWHVFSVDLVTQTP